MVRELRERSVVQSGKGGIGLGVTSHRSRVPVFPEQKRVFSSYLWTGNEVWRGKRVYLAGALVLLALFFLSYAFLLRPTQARVDSSSTERGHWFEVLALSKKDGSKPPVPTMEELPNLVDFCREAFVAEGVEVKALNVERFGEKNGDTSQPPASLDYALLRLHWGGSWAGIEKALSKLERDRRFGISAREVHLNKGGGDGLLQIYFRPA